MELRNVYPLTSWAFSPIESPAQFFLKEYATWLLERKKYDLAPCVSGRRPLFEAELKTIGSIAANDEHKDFWCKWLNGAKRRLFLGLPLVWYICKELTTSQSLKFQKGISWSVSAAGSYKRVLTKIHWTNFTKRHSPFTPDFPIKLHMTKLLTYNKAS